MCGVGVSEMLYHCILCVTLLMDLFVNSCYFVVECYGMVNIIIIIISISYYNGTRFTKEIQLYIYIQKYL